jgi:hypothetical protein
MERREKRMAKHTMKKGDFYAAKYRGSNGDLILGEVKSVRRDGDVILTNLLTGNRSTKTRKVLESRNHLVTKSDVNYILYRYKKEGKAAARLSAVRYWTMKSRPTFGSKAKAAEEKLLKAKNAKRKKLVLQIRRLARQLDQVSSDLANLQGEE